MPSPSASTPQRYQVSGMNCIQPMAPAELGPMLRPKLDSTLLIAPSTCHGIEYAAPARCQSASSCACGNCCGAAGGAMIESGNATVPATFGICALGTSSGTAWKTSARAAHVARTRQSSASGARRRTVLPRGGDPQADAVGRLGRLRRGNRSERRHGLLRLLGLRRGGCSGGGLRLLLCNGIRRALALDRLLERDEEVVL